jgi:hypothetical protein
MWWGVSLISGLLGGSLLRAHVPANLVIAGLIVLSSMAHLIATRRLKLGSARRDCHPDIGTDELHAVAINCCVGDRRVSQPESGHQRPCACDVFVVRKSITPRPWAKQNKTIHPRRTIGVCTSEQASSRHSFVCTEVDNGSKGAVHSREHSKPRLHRHPRIEWPSNLASSETGQQRLKMISNNVPLGTLDSKRLTSTPVRGGVSVLK